MLIYGDWVDMKGGELFWNFQGIFWRFGVMIV